MQLRWSWCVGRRCSMLLADTCFLGVCKVEPCGFVVDNDHSCTQPPPFRGALYSNHATQCVSEMEIATSIKTSSAPLFFIPPPFCSICLHWPLLNQCLCNSFTLPSPFVLIHVNISYVLSDLDWFLRDANPSTGNKDGELSCRE
jgi:hypothetical protein